MYKNTPKINGTTKSQTPKMFSGYVPAGKTLPDSPNGYTVMENLEQVLQTFTHNCLASSI